MTHAAMMDRTVIMISGNMYGRSKYSPETMRAFADQIDAGASEANWFARKALLACADGEMGAALGYMANASYASSRGA